MQPGPARILTCPQCGKKKEVMSLISGNTIDAEYWSDGKQIAPMLPKVSLVQKCLSCNKYYLTNKQEFVHSEDNKPSFEQGILSYPELKEAFASLKDELIDDDELSIRMMLVHSYNDWFYRSEEKHIITEDEEYFFINNVKYLIALLTDDTPEAQLFNAELYREIKEFDKCNAVLNSIFQLDGYNVYLKTELQRKANLKVYEVFLLTPLIDNYYEEQPKPTYRKVLNKHIREAEQKAIDIVHLFDEDMTIADLINETTSIKKNKIANLRFYSLGLNDIKEELTTNFKLTKSIFNIDRALNIKWITPTKLSIMFDNANTEHCIKVEFTGIKNDKRELLLQIKGELTKVEWENINDINIQDREHIIQHSIYSYLDDNNKEVYSSSN